AASVKAAAYENLAKAVNAYNNNEFDQAMNALQAVDLSQLSVEARSICAELGGTTVASMLQNFRASGLMAYNNGNYEEAVKALEKAKAIEDEDYDVLLYLGHSYRMMGDTVSADENYKRIITLWPDTNRSATAVEFVTDYSDIFQSQEPAAADNAAAAAPAAPENAAPENPAP
ncbi:MAG: tetratricopeptide repeat protein, partial [Lachnospiraceae bacterium]|nr:tetratricopeptide repeat protein [Lachnospiraceae bacterium]